MRSTTSSGAGSRTRASSAAGTSPDERLVEIIELPEHPFFVASQFHPEFNSRPTRPEPLFREFVGAASRRAAERGDGPATEETEVEVERRRERPRPPRELKGSARRERRARGRRRASRPPGAGSTNGYRSERPMLRLIAFSA